MLNCVAAKKELTRIKGLLVWKAANMVTRAGDWLTLQMEKIKQSEAD